MEPCFAIIHPSESEDRTQVKKIAEKRRKLTGHLSGEHCLEKQPFSRVGISRPFIFREPFRCRCRAAIVGLSDHPVGSGSLFRSTVETTQLDDSAETGSLI
jgi:hypothetical protein